ncbi:MAG: hypothetical protein A2Y00_07380 [Omnitrophica WOR_2 bacterium GWF2_43_52]|nr:MAG: hypothetical protein A2062_07390 [Omnitrophica WOR_2 bacterium GWA2_44_7]OGX16685.1 MAG: hypothetical protein A2Y01_01060 [Omnitrophica WOR_2 bacterium GWC2_44_8]OGX20241.1 MAG: hypothetical protein A2Y00_07380 [Omnitrophica WOR_2 bacterium GWF2_43_52]HAH20739.1 hypothetical protein [Candidatus Omnitrophota bacterium]HBG63607.1 hypothetical protein [Candidatus Omnitrophota bacterium]
MKNILYVSPYAHIGGGELSLLAILKNLNREVFKVEVVCYEEGQFVERIKETGITCKVIKRNSFFSNFSIVGSIYWLIRKKKINLVCVNSLDIRAGFAAYLAGVPFLGHLRIIFPFAWPDFLFVRLSARIMAVSHAVVDGFCAHYPQLRSKFVVLLNAVEMPLGIIPVPLRDEFGLSNNAWLIGMVGRIDPYKGHAVFVDAARLIKKGIPEAVFFIVGEEAHDQEGSHYVSVLKERITTCGLSESFVFSGFRQDIMNVISALDTVVIPSLELKKKGGVLKEGFGRVAVEAAVCGVPVVASKVGGLKEIIQDAVTGILVSADNPQELAEGVVTVFKDKEKRLSIIHEARKNARLLYGLSGHMRALEGIYCSVLGIKQDNDNPCMACGNTYFGRLEQDSGYEVLQCVRCGLSYVDPLPPEELLKERYSRDYYKPWLVRQRKARVRMWKRRIKIVNRFFNNAGRLLDVGCGEGLFLELSKADGWDVTGTEFSSFAVHYIKEKLGIEAYEGDVTDIDVGSEKFDAVTLWHVLEHTKNPLEVLKKIRDIISDNGVLIVAVPNLNNKISQVIYRFLKGKRLHLFSPADRELHLVFFTPASIRMVLDKAGFDVIEVVPDYGCIRWQERLLNSVNRLFYLISGQMVFDAFEVHARPRERG